jgi:hypothetical protein
VSVRATVVCCLALAGQVSFCEASDYSGIWKGDCSYGFGVQIKRIDGERYAVSFCGAWGCFAPGTWMPNSPIDGDPTYKVVSATEIEIRRTDDGGYFTYLKCGNDPTWVAAEQASGADNASARPQSQKPPSCGLDNTTTEEGVVIAWITDVRKTTQFGAGIETKSTTVGAFRPVAILNGKSLTATEGQGIRKGQSFWRTLKPGAKR